MVLDWRLQVAGVVVAGSLSHLSNAFEEQVAVKSDSRRDRFLHRISTVGGGTRQDIQMMVGGIVYDIRDMVERGVFADSDMDTVVAFHDRAEEFWRHTMVTNPPLDANLMVTGLRRLRDDCKGPLAGFQLRVDQAIEKAKAFATARKQT